MLHNSEKNVLPCQLGNTAHEQRILLCIIELLALPISETYLAVSSLALLAITHRA